MNVTLKLPDESIRAAKIRAGADSGTKDELW
jgi:hypothetical protein